MDKEIITRMPVLDKGFVELLGWCGSDLTVSNAAGECYQRTSEEFTDRDIRRINDLVKKGHGNPFRHTKVNLRIKAPLMVARQMWRYIVGGATLEEGTNWTEMSRRYVKEEPEFYTPERWGLKDDCDWCEDEYSKEFILFCHEAVVRYREALEAGVKPELARGWLPAYFQYVTWQWSPSLDGIYHFEEERLSGHAQSETRQYATTTLDLVQQVFPVSIRAFRDKLEFLV